MSLIDVLQRAEFAGLSDADALAHGNETVVISTDTTPYTWSGIGVKLIANGVSPTDLIQFATNIASLPGGPLLNNALLSGGFNFGDPTNRAIIESFEVSEPDWAVSVLNAMLAIGQTSGTHWQLYGVTQPLLADITAARASIANQQAIANLMNEVINPAIANGDSVAQIKTLVAAFGN